jgi:hypothetical protein
MVNGLEDGRVRHMIHALERDGKSNFTFEGERLGFGKHGIGPEAEWNHWTHVVIYRNITDATYVVQICRMTRPSSGRGNREVVIYETAEQLLAELQSDETDVNLGEATRRAVTAAVTKDPALGDLLHDPHSMRASSSRIQPAAGL